MKYYLVIIFFLLVGLLGCSHKKSDNKSAINENMDLYVVDLDKVVKSDKVNLSSYFQRAEMIVLETSEECLIGNVNKITVLDDLILVMDSERSESVFVFDREGRFKHKIGERGMGPGEYINLWDATIDRENMEIYIFDNSNNRMNRYDLNSGRFINSVVVNRDNYAPPYIQYANGKIYTSILSYTEMKDSYLLQEIDMVTGDPTSFFLSSFDYNRGWHGNFVRKEGFFYSDIIGNSKYVQMFMDTIISIEKDSRIMPYLVVKTKKWITKEDINELINSKNNNGMLSYQILSEKNLVYNIHQYVESNDIICFQIMNNGDLEYVVYDKNSNQTQVIDLFKDDLVFSGDFFIFPSFLFADENGFYSYVRTEQIPRLLDVAHSGGINPKFKDEILNLSEDSNPILIYYTKNE